MNNKLVECIPNFSAGRDKQTIASIRSAINAHSDVEILDCHSDFDHNRTVITILGNPESVSAAVFDGIKTASDLIDMHKHVGEHPRIGATDVVPFVPIQNVTMEECVRLAEQLGKRVGETLQIPVYLYEEAARSPENKNLENIRKGQFEGLITAIRSDPGRQPDFGPMELGSAGATVIGARAPLIAFNVYLTTDDVAIAKRIAKTIRFSSGGLRFVKAMGVEVDGLAQVSMNLTNFSKTSIAHVVEMIRREAGRFGVRVHHSELVGLIPNTALIDAAVWYLQLDQFDYSQILENSIQKNREMQGASHFLEALASADPTPGGGSAAAFTAAQAAALVAMVARLTIGKKKYQAVQERMQDTLAGALKSIEKLHSLQRSDEQAFTRVMEAYRMPKENPQNIRKRDMRIQTALVTAAKVPLDTCAEALAVMVMALTCAQEGNVHAVSDAGTAGVLAYAAIAAAGANTEINCLSLHDEGTKENLLQELSAIKEKAIVLNKEIKKVIFDRSTIEML